MSDEHHTSPDPDTATTMGTGDGEITDEEFMRIVLEMARAVERAAQMIRYDNSSGLPDGHQGPHPALEQVFALWPEVWYRMNESAFIRAAEATAWAQPGSTWPR